MIVGQKVGYARVSTSDQDLSLQLERLDDCDRFLRRRFPGGGVQRGGRFKLQVHHPDFG